MENMNGSISPGKWVEVEENSINQDVEATEVSTKRTDKDKWKKKTQWNITQP